MPNGRRTSFLTFSTCNSPFEGPTRRNFGSVICSRKTLRFIAMPSKHSISYLSLVSCVICSSCPSAPIPICRYLNLELRRFLNAIDYRPVLICGLEGIRAVRRGCSTGRTSSSSSIPDMSQFYRRKWDCRENLPNSKQSSSNS